MYDGGMMDARRRSLMGTYRLLDLTPRGRHEDGLDNTMGWVRHHDRYESAPAAKAGGSCCGSRA